MLSADHIDRVKSYPDGWLKVMAELGIDQEALDEELLNVNVEQCPECKWYTDSFQLLNDDEEIDGYCDNCRSYHRGEELEP